MITGLTPRQHGCLTNGTLLSERIPTITDALVDAGYRTHAVGKLHLQPFSVTCVEGDPVPSWESRSLWEDGRITGLPLPYYGFQTVDYVGGHVHYSFGDYANWLRELHPGVLDLYARDRAYSIAGQSWKMEVPPDRHYNHWISDRCIAFLDSIRPDQPFFLWCSFPDPHHPFAACRPYSDMYDPTSLSINPTWDMREELCGWLADVERPSPDFGEADLRADVAQTYGMIAHIDDNVGRVMAALRAKRLDERTIVVLMADHGEYLGSHHLLYKHIWPWEELMRVPLIWRVPGAPAVPGGSDQVVSLLDFAPTVLDYGGVDQDVLNMRKPAARSDWPGLPGRSLRSTIDSGEPMEPRPAICELDSDWQPGPMQRRRTIVGERYKLTVYPRMGEGILCDLQEDPHETRNLWSDPAYAHVKARLSAQLLEELVWSDPLNGPRVCGA
jgi:arylsulfatase A-like enzyme